MTKTQHEIELLPHSIEAEQSLLGAVMHSDKALAGAVEVLKPSDFYISLHGGIFACIATLGIEKKGNIREPFLVKEEMLRRGMLVNDDTILLLARIWDSGSVFAFNWREYASEIKRTARLRHYLALSATLSEKARAAQADPNEIIAEARASLDELETETNAEDLMSFESIFDGDAPKPKWVVDKLVPAEGITLISAKPGVGKSWLGYYISQCTASGAPLFGRYDVTLGRVLYLNAEGGESLVIYRNRKLWNGLSLEYGEELKKNLPIKYLCKPTVLSSGADFSRLCRLIEDEKADLVVIDPFIEFFDGEENSSRDTSAFFRELRKIIEKTGSAFVVTHHTRKVGFDKPNTPSESPRGSSAIAGALDSHLSLSERRGDEKQILVQHAKLRQGAEEKNFYITIEDIDSETTVIKYLGETTSTVSESEKTDAALIFITQTLEEAEKPLAWSEIVAISKQRGFGKDTVNKALKLGVDANLIVTQKDETDKRKVLYLLASGTAGLYECA
jgi:DNA-binding MarR family transcriptional regulator